VAIFLQVQFAIQSHAFKLMLREEERMQQRYSHVARMRTDAVWLSSWPQYPEVVSLVPPLSTKVAAVPAHGPLFCDYFWLSSRATAWISFYDLQRAVERPLDVKDMYDAFGCDWEAIPDLHRRLQDVEYRHIAQVEDEVVAGEGAMYGKIFTETGARGAGASEIVDDACYETIIAPEIDEANADHVLWSEPRVKYWMLQNQVELVDCCRLTGEFAHSSFRETFFRTCPGPRRRFETEAETPYNAGAIERGGDARREGWSGGCLENRC
jgi:hypothetical protein